MANYMNLQIQTSLHLIIVMINLINVIMSIHTVSYSLLINQETFPKDFIVILKRSLQNYYKILRKCLPCFIVTLFSTCRVQIILEHGIRKHQDSHKDFEIYAFDNGSRIVLLKNSTDISLRFLEEFTLEFLKNINKHLHSKLYAKLVRIRDGKHTICGSRF